MEITKQRNNLLYSSQYRTARNFRGSKICGFLKIALVSKFRVFIDILIVESVSESYLNSWKFNFVVIKDHQKRKIFSSEIFFCCTV